MRDIADDGTRELRSVVRVNLRVIPAAGHSDVRQALVDEAIAAPLGVDVDEDAIGGLALAAVARTA